MPAAATRTLTLVTLSPAMMRSAYPEVDARVIQVSYADVAPRRKGADGFIVRDSTGRIVGAVQLWEDSQGKEWLFQRVREPARVTDDPERLAMLRPEQLKAWAADASADAQVKAEALKEDLARSDAKQPATERVLLCHALLGRAKTREKCLLNCGFLLADD